MEEDNKKYWEWLTKGLPVERLVPTSKWDKKIEHELIIDLSTCKIATDSQNNVGQNMELKAEVLNVSIGTNKHTSGNSTVIFPRKSFLKMLFNGGVEYMKEGIWKIKFKILTERDYIITYKEFVSDGHVNIPFDDGEGL